MRHRSKFWLYSIATLSTSLLFPLGASAHVNAGDTSGFLHGLQHPIGGLDHIIAMMAVGLWSAQIGGRALWILPSTFVGAMIGGSILGHLQTPLPGIETGILVSDFLLGGLILFGLRLKSDFTPAIVGLLAIFHGYAHGAEMPTTAMGLAYGGGFVLATALLHAIGIGIGYAIDRLATSNRERLFQLGGVAVLLGSIYVSFN